VTRIFASLALFAVLFVAATMGLGWMLRAGDLRDATDLVTQRWGTIHRMSGVFAALVVVLVHSIVATYFIGTSRWCKEVCETYQLGPELASISTRLKRRTFPWVVMGMLVAVGVVALGGAADPGAALAVPKIPGVTWTNLHLAGAIVGLLLVCYSFVVEWNNIWANHHVIEAIMREVKRVRAERGLDTE
jgi:hypothetical protein